MSKINVLELATPFKFQKFMFFSSWTCDGFLDRMRCIRAFKILWLQKLINAQLFPITLAHSTFLLLPFELNKFTHVPFLSY